MPACGCSLIMKMSGPMTCATGLPARSPTIPDGRYCEMTFENTRPVTGIGQCITLTWEDGANGWRTDNPLLPGDEHGVSIRARKLGHGNDAVGRSGFFMVQAGPQPRQAAIGGRTVPVATPRLMAVLRRGDMFAVIDRHLPQAPVMQGQPPIWKG